MVVETLISNSQIQLCSLDFHSGYVGSNTNWLQRMDSRFPSMASLLGVDGLGRYSEEPTYLSLDWESRAQKNDFSQFFNHIFL